MKRLFDVALGLLLAPVALIVCLIVALPIAIESKASPLFFQLRLGRHERPFYLVKVRTMRQSTPNMASHEIDSLHILTTGRLLRRLKIDELPQIWNVLSGTMSFVGPRPGLPNQLELLEARKECGVFALLPGITGIAQINGVDMSTPEKLARMDALYAGEWSLFRDLNILWVTFAGGGRGDAAQDAAK